MSLNDRARQFLPFEALKGLKDALRLKEYEFDRISKNDLSEDMINKISTTLMNAQKNDIYEIKYFDDGSYKYIKGTIKINTINHFILINDIKISFNDIFDINISL